MKVDYIRPGVKAFIVHQGKILVVKERVRKEGKETVIYDVPGGGIEPGETLKEGLKREVFEEVGLKIAIEQPVGNWEFFIENPESAVHIICLGYQCRLVGSDKIDTSQNPAQEDIFEAVWLTKEEIINSPAMFVDKDLQEAIIQVKV